MREIRIVTMGEIRIVTMGEVRTVTMGEVRIVKHPALVLNFVSVFEIIGCK
jgi:hypothetical protein